MAFIDKINPDVPEGRLLIRNGDYVLKDPEAEVSSIPLDKKWERLLKYIKDKGYSTKEIDRMISAYSLVYKRRAARNIDQYNEIVKDYPLLNFQLRSLLLYDYYDMFPMNRKIYYSAYYELNDNFRNLLDDGMRTAKSMHVRDLTISVEASSCASFFEYLQKLGLKDIYDIQEEHVRKYMIYNKCKPELAYRIGLFIRRHGEFIQNQELVIISSYFPMERVIRYVYEPMSEGERGKFEDFLLDDNCPLSKRDKAICILLLYTGMRQIDVSNLKLGDIKWNRDLIIFNQTKTGKPQIIPLRPVVGNAILEYVQEERPQSDLPYIFLGKRKTKGSYSRCKIADIVNNTYKIVGIRQNARQGTHLLRHSFADEMINNGSDLSVVSTVLGHDSPQTTLQYLSSNIEKLRECALSIAEFPITHKLYGHENN